MKLNDLPSVVQILLVQLDTESSYMCVCFVPTTMINWATGLKVCIVKKLTSRTARGVVLNERRDDDLTNPSERVYIL